jgi:hypothetical protein
MKLARRLRGLFSTPETPTMREALHEFRVTTSLRSIDDLESSDVVIAGYPKSGNTWVQYMLAGAFCGVDLQMVPDALVQDLVPDVHFKKFYKRYFPVTFFKSHFLPRPEYRRVVYLLRDGRDAMVSYWHYLKAVCGHDLDFLDVVEVGDKLFPCKWHTHVMQWTENPYSASIITVRYEDLLSNPVAELRRIGEFAGLECHTENLEKAAARASFKAMRQRETNFPWENPETRKNEHFVRRGQTGSHRDEMPVPVRDAFLRDATLMLQKTGYLH